ncbi:DNA excision repair protein ERCC-5 homolog [Corythoichthys intestinalis]|uniref:DNA excision repair protein ERCC-5 homolog n=1 Tax=Corythoichthys intestinalis TaxID=161448 RepID=UPI0025A5CDB4|nr:DNA excision repair protein ERCC-5 homolog [Corythoichthys intestinalis]
MGVHGLWRLLESTGKPINPETLEGKILAVDISIWLNQAVKGVRDREGNSVQNAHLLTLFHRICKLLFFRIRPVFVFDGDAPLLKKQTLALRRQRKEELSQESKKTNEKLLRTFLKRQAIKAVLGDDSKDPLPSLSSVKRNEVDDMYVLPALPQADEERSSSEEGEEENESEDVVDEMYEGAEHFADPNSVDINSEEFACLPLEMKHEILKDMKEFSKRRRTLYHKPPELSTDFSQYQLSGLLHRNKLNQRLEGVEKEMNQRSAGSAPQFYEQEQQSHDVESRRLVSEDNSHYILIKGSTKSKIPSENQPTPAPWTGNALSGFIKRRVAKPEPLWCPVPEEEDKKQVSFSGDCKESDVTSPPSPRTLNALQVAMNDTSDVKQEDGEGSISPRSLLAIQQALDEDDDGVTQKTLSSSSATEIQIAISSSEEDETELDAIKDFVEEKSNFKENTLGKNIPDDLLDIGSDYMDEIIGQRNKAFHFAAAINEVKEGSDRQNMGEKNCEVNKDMRQANARTVSCSQTQPDNRGDSELGLMFEKEHHTHFEAADNESEQVFGKSLREAQSHIELPERGNNQFPLLKTSHVVKPGSVDDSESEESFVEVSEEEHEEDAEEVYNETMQAESQPDAAPVPDQNSTSNEEIDNETPSDGDEFEEEKLNASCSATAVNEWEDFDVEELHSLESSLQVEQSNLKEQQQQQERMANTVTGQMYLESQELLRLFGIPFLVAPMEAEAQCAALDRTDHTNGTITDDSDVWLFGGRHVYKNFFNQNKYVEHYQYSDLQNQLGLDRNKLINLAYLLGSDYTEGVPGVGYVTGMEILNEFPGHGLEPLTQFSNWWSEAQEKKRLTDNPRDTKVKKKLRGLKLQPGFPNPTVAQAYLQPAVDQSDSSFSWGHPQLDMIKEFCQSRFGWTSRKTTETLQPVIKQLNTQQTQLRIDSFFRMEQQEKQAIRSQRLRRAVTCMKRKEDGNEDMDSDEETVTPSKRGKTMEQDQKKAETGKLREQDRSLCQGGFLGSRGIGENLNKSLNDVNCSSQGSNLTKATKTIPPKHTTGQSSSSSSDEDCEDNYGKVAMVTAQPVFKGSIRGCSNKSRRGRGRGKKI